MTTTIDGTAGITFPNASVQLVAALPASVVVSTRTSNTILAAADNSTLINITSGTFSQTFTAAATLGSGWFCYIKNAGTGDITLDPNSTELIDGLSTYVMYPNECRLVQCTGTAFTSVVLSPFFKTITSTQNFISPPGYSSCGLKMTGGGGGGGGGRRGAASTLRKGGGAGGSPATIRRSIVNIAAGTSSSVAIGAGGSGGAAQTTNSTDGNAGSTGGNTTFGTLFTAIGGVGGVGGDGTNNSNTASGSGSASAGAAGTSTTGGLPSSAQWGGVTIIDNIGEGGGAATASVGGGSTEFGGAGSGNSAYNTSATFSAGSSLNGVPGAGGSGCINSANAYGQPSRAGSRKSYTQGGGAAEGISQSASTAGANGADGDFDCGGGGGGGGGASIDAAASPGGNGGLIGGPGGGGGGSTNGFASGAGGNGQSGIAYIWGIA